MRRFLKQFVIWSAFLFLFSILFDGMITLGLRRTDIRKYAVWNDIYNKKINADVVIIGSSRVWCGYDTYVIDSMLHCNSYNLGIDGHPVDFQLIRYYTYRRFNDAPKTILFNVDFLSTLHNSADSQYEREQFFPYITDKVLIQQVAATKHLSILDRYIPLYRYFGYRDDIENGLAAFLGKREFIDGGLYKGFRGSDEQWDRGEVLSKDTTIFAPIKEDAVYQLDSFVSDAVSQGIEVVFVKSPVYYPLLAKFGNVAETDSVFMNISRKNDVPILDYYDCVISRDSSMFCNASHLNRRGARVFTIKLCEDLSELRLAL